MVGPRDRRPPYPGTWYPYSTDGWGIPDFLNLCAAAGILGIPDFNLNETPQDMVDFLQYVNGSTNTVWGAKRLADGHPQPYGLKYLELGNEERVDSSYYQKFQALAQAIWAGRSQPHPGGGDFLTIRSLPIPSVSMGRFRPHDPGGAPADFATGTGQIIGKYGLMCMFGPTGRRPKAVWRGCFRMPTRWRRSPTGKIPSGGI